NGLIRTLGQVALATFTNTEGLVDEGGNLFLAGANSGTPVITTPGQMGAGFITAGALELSNVDIGEEFIKMILTSTGYSANSRVIRTADELMQQLLVLGR
ncbi:MAG: flagellar hook-basal body complex protein, partial [Phycisphaerales bacterium]